MNREFIYKAQGLWSLTENLVIIALPIPTVLKLQMHWRRRALLLLVFTVGLVYVLGVYAILWRSVELTGTSDLVAL